MRLNHVSADLIQNWSLFAAGPAKVFIVREYSWECFLYVKPVCLVIFTNAAFNYQVLKSPVYAHTCGLFPSLM